MIKVAKQDCGSQQLIRFGGERQLPGREKACERGGSNGDAPPHPVPATNMQYIIHLLIGPFSCVQILYGRG